MKYFSLKISFIVNHEAAEIVDRHQSFCPVIPQKLDSKIVNFMVSLRTSSKLTGVS